MILFGKKKKTCQVIIKSANRVVLIKFIKLPMLGEDLIVPYKGENHLVKVVEIIENKLTQIFAEEID